MSEYEPSRGGVQETCQSTQVSGDSGGDISAAAQLRPPSALHSTDWIPLLPAKATPASVSDPGPTRAPSCGVSMREVVLTAAWWSQPCPTQYPPLSELVSSISSSHFG